jgi:hypothetical protein
MRALNLAILLAGLTLVGFALYGMTGLDTTLRLAAAHEAQPATPPQPDPRERPDCDEHV